MVSLGKDQDLIARKVLTEAIKDGNWVVFENSHIASDLMLTLESLFIDLLRMDEIDEEFRWWFILEPSKTFPLIILRDGVQIVNEPPENIRDKMSRKYLSEPLNNDKFFENAFMPPLSTIWYKHVFALNAFHATLQTRKLFGSIGWSHSNYEFNENLFDSSISQLRTFMKQSGSIPFDSVWYVVGELYYGNEIIDLNDRRLLFSMLDRFCSERMSQSQDGYKFFDDGNIQMPTEPNKTNSIQYLSHQSEQLMPQDVGLHGNASYHRSVRAGFETLKKIYRTQYSHFIHFKPPESISNTVDGVKAICKDILKKIPPKLELVTTKFGDRTFENAFQHEMQRYQSLLKIITQSLDNILDTVQGLVIGDKDFDQTFWEFAANKVPSIWDKKNYLTDQTLTAFIEDLKKRIPYFQKWAKSGTPNVIRLPYLYHPQAIITTIKLNFAKRNHLEFDEVSLSVEVTELESSEAEDIAPLLKVRKIFPFWLKSVWFLMMICHNNISESEMRK